MKSTRHAVNPACPSAIKQALPGGIISNYGLAKSTLMCGSSLTQSKAKSLVQSFQEMEEVLRITEYYQMHTH